MKYCFLLVLVIGALILPSLYCDPVSAEEGDPLVALIVNENDEHLHGYYDMDLNGTVVLFGVASGGYIPCSYSWYVDGVLAATGYLFNYSATPLGEHTVRMEVTDAAESFASDDLVIRVQAPVSTGEATWGSIKALFGK
jgi:hypothetical protein